jgi:hypothetical protein
VVAVVAGTTQVYNDETPLTTRVPFDWQVLLGPVKIQCGSAVGATEPVTPVMVAWNVMIGPFTVLDCSADTDSVTAPLFTEIGSAVEIMEL